MASTRKPKREALNLAAFGADVGKFAPEKTHGEPTEEPRKGHKEATEGPHNERGEVRKVRLTGADWEGLAAIAEQEGTSRAAIIRRLVRQELRRRSRDG